MQYLQYENLKKKKRKCKYMEIYYIDINEDDFS